MRSPPSYYLTCSISYHATSDKVYLSSTNGHIKVDPYFELSVIKTIYVCVNKIVTCLSVTQRAGAG